MEIGENTAASICFRQGWRGKIAVDKYPSKIPKQFLYSLKTRFWQP